MKKRFMILAAAMLVLALSHASTALADPWPQPAVSNYFGSCITIHKERWPSVSGAALTRLCTCKVSKLQGHPWEQFDQADKEINSYLLGTVCRPS